MSLTHFFYEPFYSTSELERFMDDAFSARTNQSGQLARTSGDKSLKPRMDLKENAENNTVSASFEFPGLQKEDVQIDVHNGLLTVSGETKGASETEERGYAVRERRYGKFSRTVKLPQGINEDEIKASMEHGVLTVTFPKSAPNLAPKKITIA